MDMNSRVNAKVVANLDAGRTYRHTHKPTEKLALCTSSDDALYPYKAL